MFKDLNNLEGSTTEGFYSEILNGDAYKRLSNFKIQL